MYTSIIYINEQGFTCKALLNQEDEHFPKNFHNLMKLLSKSKIVSILDVPEQFVDK